MPEPPVHADLLELLRSGSTQLILRKVAELARLMNRQSSRAAIMLNRGQGFLSHAASDGLESDYIEHIQAIRIDADYPSCGRCAALGTEVLVDDVEHDPAWQPFADLTRKYQIAACWSFPIWSDDRVAGTLAVYHREARLPTELERDAMRYLATLAGLAVGKAGQPVVAGEA